jgi:four helix bundle protein
MQDLVDRTFRFACSARAFVRGLPPTAGNREDARQFVRSSGSIAANYLEAQEAVSRPDFFFRIRLCRKEARESGLWLRLLDCGDRAALAFERDRLLDECGQLTRIFSAIAARDRG